MCSGLMEHCDVLSIATRHANQLPALINMDFVKLIVSEEAGHEGMSMQ